MFGFERIPHAVRCDGFVCRRLTSGVSAEVSDGQMLGCLDALAITLRSSPEYSLLDVQKVVGFLKEAGLHSAEDLALAGRGGMLLESVVARCHLLILHLLSFLLVWLRQNTSQRVKDFWSQSCLELWFQNRVLPGLWRTKAQEEHICGSRVLTRCAGCGSAGLQLSRHLLHGLTQKVRWTAEMSWTAEM